MKNKSLIIAGSVLTGVGSALTLSTGLAYYFKYKQGKLTDSEWFKSSDAAKAATFDTLAAAADNDAAALAAANASAVSAAVAAVSTSVVDSVASTAANLSTIYKDLSLADTINFYKFWIIFASTFIENLDETNPTLDDLIIKLKALQAASQKKRDTLYALVSLFGAVGPATVIAGVPTLVTGLVRNNIK